MKKGIVVRFWLCGILIFRAFEAGATTSDPYKAVNAGWERFGSVYSHIMENYYAELDQEKIMQAAIEGMLGELDSYSQFYNEEGLRQLRQDTTGKFAGLGITVAIKDRYPVVISPIEDTPASRAGLQPGDLIVAVEGRDTQDMSLEEVVNALRGDPGTAVAIEVAHRLGGPRRVMSIEREIIKIRSVALIEEIQDGIGYISLRQTRFSENTADEVEEALKELMARQVEGLILDLRGNPGGLLSQAIQVADLFLPKGAPIVSIKERDGRREEIKYSQRQPVAGKLPLVILIDEGSASAAEIVAGAVQDNDRGVIIGATSFGKGSVQTIFDLHQASESALKLTTALYYTPSGRSIHREHSGVKHLLYSVHFGDRELPAAPLFDLVLKSTTTQAAILALQARFDLDEETARRILATPLTRLVSGAFPPAEKRPEALADGAEKAYYTQKGRKVYGGGGIKPDISIEPDRLPGYVLDLERRRVFFDFVVDCASADTAWIAAHQELEADDEMVEKFKEFLRQRNELPGESRIGQGQIEALRDLAEEMGWGQAMWEAIDRLEKALAEERVSEFTPKLKPYIQAALRRELALRFKGKKAQLRLGLEDDLQLSEAVRVLQDGERYRQVLAIGIP